MRFQDFLCSHDRVCDDSDIMGIIYFHSWGEANMYSHELSFNRCDVHSLDLGLIDNMVVEPNVGGSCCNMGFLYASISNDSGMVE